MSWKELSRASLSKTLPNLVGAGTTLGQSANFHHNNLATPLGNDCLLFDL